MSLRHPRQRDGLHIRRYLIAVPDGGRYEYPFLTSWPDYKPDPNTAYGYEDVKVTPPIPSPAAIRRMEEVLVWLQLAPVEYRRLLWFRAEGWSWRKLGRHFGCGGRQVKLRWRDGVVSLWERLCRCR
jgi:hypothetical protein